MASGTLASGRSGFCPEGPPSASESERLAQEKTTPRDPGEGGGGHSGPGREVTGGMHMGRTGRSLSLGRSQLGSRVQAGSRGPWLSRLSRASRGKATPQGSSCPEAGHRFWEKERPGPGRGWVLSSLSPQDLPPPTPPILPTGAAVGDPGVPSASGDTLLGVSGRSSHPRQLLHGLRVRGAEPDREAAHQGGQGQQHGRGVRQGRQHLEGAPACPPPAGPICPHRPGGEHPPRVGQQRGVPVCGGACQAWPLVSLPAPTLPQTPCL